MEAKKEPRDIYKEYQEGIDFNRGIKLYKTVKTTNDFYNDKQWEGVNAPDLDKPVINIIKPSVNYFVAQLVTDDVAISLESIDDHIEDVVTREINKIMENTSFQFKNRQLIKNMALDGDMVLYSYMDNDSKGIMTEIIYNTDIIFGDPTEPEIQAQPYVIVQQKRPLMLVKEYAKDKENLKADDDYNENNDFSEDDENNSMKYVTLLNKFWKENGTIHYIQVTKDCVVREETDLKYHRYPIAYRSWETVKNNYHGVSPVAGKIKNQIFVNKLYAMAMAYLQNYAFPKVLFDKAKLPDGWDPRISRAIATNGNPNDVIFSTFKPSDMSTQVAQFIESTIEDTKESMGVYDAALGNIRPDNTSAIVATQKAAAAPLDLQRLDFYHMVKDIVRIWLDIIGTDYGKRNIINPDGTPETFDFGILKKLEYNLKVDVGASSYWTELMQIDTLSNLLMNNFIDKITFLKYVPDGYIKDKPAIINDIQEADRIQQEQAMQMQMAEQQAQQQVQELKNEEQAIKNANSQADLIKKVQDIKTMGEPPDTSQYGLNQF